MTPTFVFACACSLLVERPIRWAKFAGMVSVMRVAAPGMMALQVIPYLASALAQLYVRPKIPALAAA